MGFIRGAAALTASKISVTPVGNVASTNVQSAVAELDSEKVDTGSLTAHTGASTNIHGLPANVAPLGNRNAAGEFVQRGNATASGSLASYTLNSYRGIAINFPVAYSSAPRVFPSSVFPCAVQSITNTGCTLFIWGDASLVATNVISWIAIGS